MKTLTLVPAYGRDYKSQNEVIEDWNKDKDFQIANAFSPYDGKYCNQSNLKEDKTLTAVNIRYSKLTKIAVLYLAKTYTVKPKPIQKTPILDQGYYFDGMYFATFHKACEFIKEAKLLKASIYQRTSKEKVRSFKELTEASSPVKVEFSY
jgi:hypothetical protein